MTTLDRLIAPESIAIVGLSDDPAKHGGRVLAGLRKLGYGGSIWGVNPRLPTVDGVEVYGSIADLPSSPDVVACAIPAAAIPKVLSDADASHAGAAVIFAGGFGEAGDEGIQLQDQAIDAAGTVRLLGPNSGGVIRPGGRLAISFLTCLDRPADEIRPGPVGLVTQSGGTGSYIHNLAAEKGGGLGISISTGNEVDIDIADGIDALVELPEIKAIALVVETVRNGPGFLEAVRRATAAGKPVVACRIGSSEHGRSMAQTHTGAMARASHILDGVLDSLGVVIAETPAELLEIADIAARAPKPAGDRVAMVTHSGGIAILLTDLAEQAGLNLPAPDTSLKKKLEPLLDHGTAENPLDMGGIIGGPTRFGQVVDAFCESNEFDTVLAVSTAHPRAHSGPRAQALVASPNADRLVHLWMAGDVGAEGMAALMSADAPVTYEPRAAIKALVALGRASDPHHEPHDRAQRIGRVGRGTRLSEHRSKRMIAKWGIPIPEGSLATSAVQAAEAAERLGGSVAMKICSPDILHKTDIGGIRLGVRGGRAATEIYSELVAAGASSSPNASIEGVLVEHEVAGFEVIVGGLHDPVFGPMILLGPGGLAAESFGPPSMAPAPLTPTSARRMIENASVLPGALARLDEAAPEALAVVLVEVSRRLNEVIEFEINPLAWSGSQWIALDALVETTAPEG